MDGRVLEAEPGVHQRRRAGPPPRTSRASTGVTPLDSTSIMELDRVPEHLLVLGGGYIGLEFGQMFRRFGSRVTIVQRGRQLLPLEDEDVAAAVLGDPAARTASTCCSRPKPVRAERRDGGRTC